MKDRKWSKDNTRTQYTYRLDYALLLEFVNPIQFIGRFALIFSLHYCGYCLHKFLTFLTDRIPGLKEVFPLHLIRFICHLSIQELITYTRDFVIYSEIFIVIIFIRNGLDDAF